jgi:hypothetical protein
MFLVPLTLARKCQLNLRTEGVYPRALRHRYLTRRLVPIRNSKLQYVGMMS